MTSSCQLHQLLGWGRDCLKQADIETGWIDARLLLAYVLNCSLEELMAQHNRQVEIDKIYAYIKCIQRRQFCEPVSRIIRQREFWSLSFEISLATLDPRPETELIIETILKRFTNRHERQNILDLGTGSGCILLSLLKEYPNAFGTGTDISFNALKTAQKNAENLKLHHRVSWLQSHWAQAIEGTFDIIVSNPPYIPLAQILKLTKDVKLYDPLKALDGGEDGLLCYQQFAHQLKPLCHQNTCIYLEIGQGQEHDVTHIMSNAGLELMTWYSDLAGIVRCGVFKVAS